MSHLKKELGGKISSKTMKKSREAASKAIKNKIAERRKAGERDAERKLSGLAIFH